MFSPERSALIAALEAKRKSRIITLVTVARENLNGQMADDQVRIIYDHLLKIRGESDMIERLDLFLVSNGGNGVIPWRLISVFREFASHVAVLIPYRAYSAATLTALGADEIVMGPFGQMGPIDPTVQNDFNPIDPQTNQKLGISVEDVKSYVQFIRSTAKIENESDVTRALEALLRKVHPLALGNVERFLTQSRMIARKLLLTHMDESKEKEIIDEIIENMASKLYFHGHPINRVEAAGDLRIRTVSKSDRSTDDAMWSLYLSYESLFEMNKAFNPLAELVKKSLAAPPIRQTYANAFNAALQGGANQANAMMLALQHSQNMQANAIDHTEDVVVVTIESTALSDVCRLRQRYELLPETNPGQTNVRQEALGQEWIRSEPPALAPTQAV